MGGFKIDVLKLSILANFILLCVLGFLHIFSQPLHVITALFLTLLALSSSASIYFFIHTRITRPAAQLRSALQALIQNDLKRFNIALSELARGNITVNLESVRAKPLNLVNNRYLGGIGRQYNEIVTSFIDCINDYNSITSIPCKRLCYVGADSFLEGEMCGEILGNLLHGKGRVAVLMHSFTRSAQSIRKKGFTSTLAGIYPEVDIAEVLEENEDQETTYKKTCELLQKYPDLKAIYVTEGSTPSMAAKAVKDMGKTGAIAIIAHDITAETIRYMEQGLITATLSQNPYMQGYNPLVCLYNYLVNKEIPATARMLTHLEEVNGVNYREHWDPQSGEILSEKARQALTAPVENSRKENYKIAILLPYDKNFWEPVYKGALDAGRLLQEEYSTQVDVIVPEGGRAVETETAIFLKYIRDLVERHYQAIALPLFDKEMIPHINGYIEQGVAFATFNAEPLSFRGMFATLFNNTLHLSRASEDLAAATTQLGQAAAKISNTMNLINDSVASQVNRLTETEEQIDLLFAYVTTVTEKSSQSHSSADKTQESARKGSEVVDISNTAMINTLKATRLAGEKMNKLSENALKIQNIVTLINDIAMRTNLIAINASILAARAGKQGREFTVVAGEIISLAEKSEQSSDEIKTNIDTILANVNEVTVIITKGMDNITESSRLSQTARNMLTDIVTASTQNKTNTEDIVAEITKMKSASENVRTAMTMLDEINQKNTGAIAEVTSSIREISNQVSEDSKVALTLNQMARSQKDLLSQFFFEEEKL